MKVEELKIAYEKAVQSGISEQMKFKKLLLENDDIEVIEFHYNLLRNRDDWRFFCSLRAAFKQRKKVAEEYLLSVLEREEDTLMIANILQLLGGLRSKKARNLAMKYITSEHPPLRHAACFVLGWVGRASDLLSIVDLLHNDSSKIVRGDAATSQRQMFFRLPKIKDKAIESLKKALITEKENEVIESIIISLQDIMKKRFGLKENIDERTIEGDLEKAKSRALKALAKVK